MPDSTRRRLQRQSKNQNEQHSSGILSRDYRYKDIRFREPGGSKEMAVDGSVAAVDFFIQPAGGELWIIDYVTLLLIDAGDMNANVFGALGAALGTGLQLIERINGAESIYSTIQDNADLAQFFFGGTSTIGAGGGVDAGFLNTVDKALGRITFDGKITLDGDDNDRLIIRVNDDLTGIDTLMTSVHIREERP